MVKNRLKSRFRAVSGPKIAIFGPKPAFFGEFLTQRHKVAKKLAALQKLLRVLASWCETAAGSKSIPHSRHSRDS